MSQTSTAPAAAVRATASSYTLPTAIASSQSPSQQPQQQQQQQQQPQVRRPPVVLRTKSPQPKVSSTTQRSTTTTAVPVANAAPNNNNCIPPYALAAGSPTSDGERLFPVGAPPPTTSQQKQTNGLGNQQRLQSLPSSRAAPLNVPSSSSPQRSRSTSPRLNDGNPLSAVGTMQVSAGTSRTVSPASSSLAQHRNFHKSSSPVDLGGDSQTPCTSDLDRSPSPDPQDVLVQELRRQLSDARQEIAELRRLLAEKEFALSTTQNLFSQFALQLTNNTQQQQHERSSRSRSPPNRSASVSDVDHTTAAQLYHRRAMERYHDRRIALTPLYPQPSTLPTVTNTLFSTMTQQPRVTPYQDQRERNPLNRLQFLPLSEGLKPRAASGPNNNSKTAMGTAASTVASTLHPKKALRKRKSSSNSTSQLSTALPPPQHDDESDDLSDLVFDEPKTQANWITPAMPLSSPPTSGRAMFGTSPSASSSLRSAQYKSTHSQGARANSGSVQPLDVADDSSDRLAATNWLELSEDESTGQQFVSLHRPAPSSAPPAKVVNLDVGYHTIRSNNEQQQKRETEFNTFWPYRQA